MFGLDNVAAADPDHKRLGFFLLVEPCPFAEDMPLPHSTSGRYESGHEATGKTRHLDALIVDALLRSLSPSILTLLRGRPGTM